MTKVLYGGDPDEQADWCNALREALPDINLYEDPASAPSDDIDLLIYEPTGLISDFSPYRKLAGILGLWAGVDSILANRSVPETIPLMRMVEDGLRRGMTEYILGHVLRLHLDMERYRSAQMRREWIMGGPKLAEDRSVGILGLGELGRDAARALVHVGFQVSGWSRTRKSVDEVTSFAGAEELPEFLSQAEILVLLAPHTPQTENLMNAERLALLPKGAHLINAARGPLIDDAAVLSALDAGHLASATLDVFRDEPLPEDHPYWRHPGVTITPHIASVTRLKTAVKVIAEQITRFENGQSFLYQVDRERGY